MVNSLVISTIFVILETIFKSGAGQNFEATSRPHILWIVLDDFGWSDISFPGHGAEFDTPHINHLLFEGIALENYYVHETCTPTRSAFMTGQYAFSLGLQYLDTMPIGTTEHIPPDAPTIAEMLKSNGYRTEMIGKWHLGYASWDDTPTGRGFDNHYGFFQDAQYYYNHTVISPKPVGFEEKHIPPGYDFWFNRFPDLNAYNKYSSDIFHDRFKKVINEYVWSGTTEPLFIYLPLQTIHTPLQYPTANRSHQCDHIQDEHRRVYCLKIVYQDHLIGEMMHLYRQYHLWDNAMVILTTDNGGMVNWVDEVNSGRAKDGVAQSYGCNMPYRGGKATLYEGGIKAIGAITGGVIPDHLRGKSSDLLMHAIDWVPTILGGALGLDLSDPTFAVFDGENVWDYLIYDQPTDDFNFHRILFLDIEKDGNFSAVRQFGHKYFTGPSANALNCNVGLRNVCLLYHGYYPCDQSTPNDNIVTETQFLYNLLEDPYETNNLIHEEWANDSIKYFEYLISNRMYIKYRKEQNPTFHPEALKSVYDYGVWAPWL